MEDVNNTQAGLRSRRVSVRPKLGNTDAFVSAEKRPYTNYLGSDEKVSYLC